MESDENKIEEVKKALGEPVFIQTNEDVAKSRRVLMFLNFLAVAYKLSGAQISTFEPAGITFTNYKPMAIDIALFCFVFYHFLHFLWKSYDELLEWRIRLTGSKLSYITTARLADSYSDYPNDPRQSSLMTWWTEEAPKIGNIRVVINQLKDISDELQEHASAKDLGELPNVNSIIKANSELQNRLAELGRNIQAADATFKSVRISESLERFEKWYRLFAHSQLIRFLTLEWIIPIGLSLWALYLVRPW